MKRILILSTVLMGFTLLAQGQAKGPEIKFENIEHNYGQIPEGGGVANHTFTFTNTGDEPLVLTKVQPGCGCTASDYTKTPILPGERGMVTAGYNPLGRPGAFKKSIMVVSNAKSTPTLTLFISGNVIPKPKDYTDTFRVHLGDLLFERNNPVFHQMQPDEVRNDTIRFFNNSDKEMEIALKSAPDHITVKVMPAKVKSRQRGYMVFTYNAGKANTSGNRNDRLQFQTNDPKQELKIIFVSASILERAPEPTPAQKYPYQMGSLRMTRNSISFPEILNTQKKSDTLVLYNDGKYPVTIKFSEFPAHVTPTLSNPTVEPGKTIVIRVEYDATKTEKFGFNTNDRVYMQTNDSLQPLKVFYISANVKEDFSKMTPKQLANAPKATFEERIFDFGTKPSGPAIPHSFILTNTGKSDLIIRNVQASCGCTATKPEKTVIKPGEKSKIDITFDTKHRNGMQHKSITVVTNDPENSVILLQVKGTLEQTQQ
ncbi:MAG: DUF1573 domain-containing protein [Bacteroidales bacterium]